MSLKSDVINEILLLHGAFRSEIVPSAHRLQGDFSREIQLDVRVEEALTLRRQNITKHITVHKYKYTLELIRTSKYFKPGLKYSAYVSAILISCYYFI